MTISSFRLLRHVALLGFGVSLALRAPADPALTPASAGVSPALQAATVLPAITAISAPRQVVNTGQSLMLSITAADATTYQWKRNGRPLAGATGASYSITNAAYGRDAGWYQVVVGNAAGSVTSAVIFVNVAVGRVVAWGDNADGQTNVPAALSGVTAISAGFSHSLALRADGTVVAWGSNGFGQTNVPPGLNDVVAIAAANSGSIALKANGTLVAWGNVAVPAGATDVVAVAADYHTLVVKANGTVLAAGSNDFGQLNIPAGLTGVVAVAAGGNGCLALKDDGSVVAWGSNLYGQAGVPAGLTGVIDVANSDRGYALKSDGTVAVWGAGLNVGQTRMPNGQAGVTAIAARNVGSSALLANGTVAAWGVASPSAGLTHVVAIAQGTRHLLALQDAAYPLIVAQPASVTVTSGQPASLAVTATGGTTIGYQWRRAGIPITGATGATYTIGSAQRLNSDWYDVVVTIDGTALTSSPAWLSVAPSREPGAMYLDPGFDCLIESLGGTVHAIVPQAGGKLLVGGDFIRVHGTGQRGIARLNADGSIDPTFLPGSGPNGPVYAIAVQPDGRIVIAGDFTLVAGTARSRIARLHADGSLDDSFDPGAGADQAVYAMRLASDGTIQIGGAFTRVNNIVRNRLARLTPQGAVAASFDPGTGPNADVYTFAWQADGRLIVGGTFTQYAGLNRARVVRVNTDGSLDPTFYREGPTDYTVRVVAVQPDGRILIGGESYTQPGYGLARLHPDGSADTTFNTGTGPNGSSIEAIVVQPDGRILIGGWIYGYNNEVRSRMARLNADGSLDSFMPDTIDLTGAVRAIAILPAGELVIGGTFYLANSPAPGLRRLHATGATDRTFNFESRVPGQVTDVAWQPDGKLLVAGRFNFINGTRRNHIARVSVAGTLDATFDPGTGFEQAVERLVLQPDGRVVAGGFFNSYQGVARFKLVRIQTDGTLDSSFNPGIGPNYGVLALALQPDGKLLIGGAFTNYAGTARNNIARLNADGSLDATFQPGTGVDNWVFDLGLQPDGRLLVGGWFNGYNGAYRGGIVRVLASGAIDPTFVPAASGIYNLNTLALQPDGKVMLGGSYMDFGGVIRLRVARLQADGALDAGFVPGALDGVGIVGALLRQADGKFLVGQEVNSSSSGVTTGIARIMAWGDIDPTFFVAGLKNAKVSRFSLLDDGRVLLAGDFFEDGMTQRAGLAMLAHLSAPAITTAPVAQTINVGASATFAVTAVGGALRYQWYFNGQAIPGATLATLVVPSVGAGSAGSYAVTVSNPLGSVASSSVDLNVAGLVTLATAPASRSVGVGGTTVFSVGASSTLPLAYQWARNGFAIAGATGASHTIAPLTVADAGAYTVTVRTAVHAATTEPATLIVLPNPIAYSGRQFVGPSGVQAFFSIDGTEAKRVLLRVLGPTLASHGVAGVLGDPALVLLDAHGRAIAANDNWAELGASAAGEFAAVGASPLPAGSADAAIIATLSPGSYAVRIHGVGGATGVALLELFDATTNSRSRIGYVAVRGRVEAAGGGLAAGLTITNSAPKRLLVRAVGASAGGAGSHPDPQLQVLDGNVIVAQNDNWLETTDAIGLAAQAGAFGLLSGSKDAAILINERVGTGIYTAQVPATGSAGDVLLEVYDVPVSGSSRLPPLVVGAPVNTTVPPGGGATLAVAAIGQPPLVYQWRKDGIDVPGGTAAVLTLSALQGTDGGRFDVLVRNALGTATSSPALVTVGTHAAHAVAGPGYVPGRSLTITNVLSYTGTATGLGWQVTLPAGWTYAGSAGSLGGVLPSTGAAGTLAWTWATVPASPVVFSYTLNVPAGESGPRTIAATANVQPAEGARIDLAAAPAPLPIGPAPIHSADTDADFRLGLLELTRVIELYNTRNGTQRTGAYRLLEGTEDGFAADGTRAAGSIATLVRFHSADTAMSGARDGRIDLGELTRVIQLYNFRAGTTRTGQYHPDPANAEDGFGLGP